MKSIRIAPHDRSIYMYMANAETDWKTLQAIPKGNENDRRHFTVGWMEASDVDV